MSERPIQLATGASVKLPRQFRVFSPWPQLPASSQTSLGRAEASKGLKRPREETYHLAGVYSFGEGVFCSQIKKGAEFSYMRLTRLYSENFVYPKLMAWEGALVIVPPECNGLVVSPEFSVFEINTDRVLPETLDVYHYLCTFNHSAQTFG